MNNYQQILTGVSHLNKHYRELERISGANFNIFRIINVSSDELKHSSFIAELLNPKGSHGQGSVFLKLFTEQLGISPFVCDNAKVHIEKSIGKVTEEDGGRLDIYIDDRKGNAIVIENKIYADDQPNQLIRYYKFNPKHVYYLTLYGGNAKEKSAMNATMVLNSGEHYKPISYQSDIVSWLEICRKEAAQLPLLREGISHYINLIKYLTGQSTNKAMTKEIIEIATQNEQNLRSAKDIASNFSAIKHNIQWQFWKALRLALESKGVKLEDNPQNTVTSPRAYNFYFGKDKHFGLWCEIYNKDGITVHWGCVVEDCIYYGFTVERNGKGGISQNEEFINYRNIVVERDSNYILSAYWLGWQHTSPQLDFRAFNSDVIFSMANEKELKTIVENIAVKAVGDMEFVEEKLNALHIDHLLLKKMN